MLSPSYVISEIDRNACVSRLSEISIKLTANKKYLYRGNPWEIPDQAAVLHGYKNKKIGARVIPEQLEKYGYILKAHIRDLLRIAGIKR